jgi:hypothetical protein
MKIFLGSSSEASHEMDNLASWIEAENHIPVRWDAPGLFQPGDDLFPKLGQISREVDAAIFIFSEDDRVWFREEVTKQPRDNVLLEYGLFAGALGSKATIICQKGRPRQPLDLQGIIYVDLDRPNDARVRTREWMSSLSLGVDRLRPPTRGQGGIVIDASHNQGEWHQGSIFDLAATDRGPLLKLIPDLATSPWEFLTLENASQLNDANLAAWRGLMFGMPYHQTVATETCEGIVKWVRGGGRLLLLGFELGDRHHAANLNRLAEPFGLHFNSDIVAPRAWQGGKPFDVRVEFKGFDSTEHPVLAGVTSLSMENCCTLNTEPGLKPLVTIGDNQLCTIKQSKVKFVNGELRGGGLDFEFRPDTSWWPVVEAAHQDLTGGGQVLAIGTWDFLGRRHEFLDNPNNARFLRNLLNWLAAIE